MLLAVSIEDRKCFGIIQVFRFKLIEALVEDCRVFKLNLPQIPAYPVVNICRLPISFLAQPHSFFSSHFFEIVFL